MVELQAQALSHELQTAVRGANLLTNPPPREVSPYVEQLLTLTLALTLTLDLALTLALTLALPLALTLTR